MNKSLVVIGNFDGVHRGHQAVLAAAHRRAEESGLTPRLMTFHPHPAVTLGRQPPAVLTSLGRKLELAQRACPGVEPALIEFTPEFAAQSPAEFVERVLRERLNASVVMVGANFRFGRNRSGDLAALMELGTEANFEVVPTDLEGDADGAWSSTRIRQLIASGDMIAARAMLGRPHMLSGTVVKGHQRGRQLGFPTCNIADFEEAMPPFGVYAVLIDRQRAVADGETRPRFDVLARGVANLGIRPTIGAGETPLLEAHAFDFDGDLYGATLRVHLVEQLRLEKKFDGLEALRAQIAADSERARAITSTIEPSADLTGWA